MAAETLSSSGSGTAGRRGDVAIQPLVRESLVRLLPDDVLPAAPAIGAYWTRTNDVEIDIVGANREPVARELLLVGSVK